MCVYLCLSVSVTFCVCGLLFLCICPCLSVCVGLYVLCIYVCVCCVSIFVCCVCMAVFCVCVCGYVCMCVCVCVDLTIQWEEDNYMHHCCQVTKMRSLYYKFPTLPMSYSHSSGWQHDRPTLGRENQRKVLFELRNVAGVLR